MATPLTLRFQTDVSAAQSGMASLAASVVSNMTKASGALALVVQNLDKTNLAFQRVSGSAAAVPKLASDLASGVAAFIAFKVALDLVAAAGKAAMDALEGTAKVGADADRLGVSTTFLQSYQAQARDLKLEVDDVTKSLEQAKAAFTIKQGENGNPNQSAFMAQLRRQQAAGNVTPEQVATFGRANGEEAQYRAALTILGQLLAKGKEVAALDLASKIMPEKMVQNIRDGTIEIDKLKKGIDDLKNPNLVLLSPEEITRAQELQRRLEAAQATLDTVGKEFTRDLARAGARLAEDAVRWKETIAEGARILLNASRFAAQAGREYSQGGGLSSGGNPSGSAGSLGATLGRAAAANRGVMTGEQFGPLVDQDREAAMRRLQGNLGNQTLIGQAQRASIAMARGIRENTNPFPETGRAKKPTAPSETDPIETFVNQLEKSAAALKAEADAFNKSNAEKQVAIQLAKAQEIASQNGKTLTDAQTEAIKKAATETANYRDKLQDLEQAQRQAAEAARYFGQMAADSLADAVLEGRSFNDILMSLEKQLARAALQGIFTGTGSLASLLGTAPTASSGDTVGGIAGMLKGGLGSFGGSSSPLQGPTMSGATLDTVAGGSGVLGLIGSFFGQFRANGGPVQAGMPYTVGEMGREMFIPDRNGQVVPIGRGGGGDSYSGPQSMALSVDVSGARGNQEIMSMVQAGVQAGITGYNQKLQRDLPMMTMRAQSRFSGPKR